jgi:hypothetical protein
MHQIIIAHHQLVKVANLPQKKLRMKLSIVVVFALVCFNAFSQKDARESYQPSIPIVIDGDPSEWKTDWMLDQDGKFLYNVGNDQSNLYFRIKISDDLTQQKIALFGLQLRLDVNGKKKGKIGLKYPVGKDARQLKKEPEPLPQDLASRIIAKKLLLDEVEVLELMGLAKENIVSSRLGLMNGIEVLIVVADDGSYLYEAKIPFKAYKIKKEEVSLLGVTIETAKPNLARNGAAAGGANQAPGNFGQSSFGQYSPLMAQAYMWAPIKLK